MDSLTRSETEVDTGLWYSPGDPVTVHITKRDRRLSVSDSGAAIDRAGRPPGWREVADRLARELVVNVTRQGVVWLPVVPVGPGREEIVRRIGEASLALYQDLLELQP
jgi:hypothetical protein